MKKRWHGVYGGSILLLLALNVFFALRLIQVSGVVQHAQAAAEESASSHKEISFLQLFTEKVLKAEGEVDFETRLQLENQVRALGDAQVLAVWKRFVASTRPEEAQAAVAELLILLIQKL